MKHCIIIKWNEDVNKDDILIPIKELFKDSINIDGISSVSYIKNCMDISNRYDLMIQIDIEKDKLSNWNDSNIHKQWKAEFSKYMQSKAIFDYE